MALGLAFRDERLIAGLVARQIEAGELADHGIAADPDLGGDFTAGQAGVKVDFQELEALDGPGRSKGRLMGRCVGGHEIGSRLDRSSDRLASPAPNLRVLRTLGLT